MSKFAILDENNNVINIIIADSLNIAQQVTGSELIIPIEENDQTAFIGGVYDGKKFLIPDFIKPLTTEQMIAQRQERIKNGEITIE